MVSIMAYGFLERIWRCGYRRRHQVDTMATLTETSASMARYAATEEDDESRALLESLMDEIDLDGDAEGEPVVRMLKHKKAQEDISSGST